MSAYGPDSPYAQRQQPAWQRQQPNMGIGPSNPQNMMQTQQQGPPQEGWQQWFQNLTAGKEANSQTLESLRGEIEGRGARLGNANASGIIDSIILNEGNDPRGRVIDVGQAFSGTPGSGKWQWGDWGWGDETPSMGMGGNMGMGGSMGIWGKQQQQMMDPKKRQMQMHQQYRAGQMQRQNQRGMGTGIGPSQRVQYY
jgi:hypothetical protein